MLIVNRNQLQYIPPLFLGTEPMSRDLRILVFMSTNVKILVAMLQRSIGFACLNILKLKLCKDLLLPIFYYDDILCTNLRKVAFNSCTRYMFDLRRFDHRSLHRNALLDMPFKVTGCPSYLCTGLVRGSSRTIHFVLPNEGYGKDILVSGWNSLPVHI
jgi:hypothetical protein